MSHERGPRGMLPEKKIKAVEGTAAKTNISKGESTGWRWVAAAGASVALMANEYSHVGEPPQAAVEAAASKTPEKIIMPRLRVKYDERSTPPEALQAIVEQVRSMIETEVKTPEVQKMLHSHGSPESLTSRLHIEPMKLATQTLSPEEGARVVEETNAAIDHAKIFFEPSRLIQPKLEISAAKHGEQVPTREQPAFDEKNNIINIHIIKKATGLFVFSFEVTLPDGSTLKKRGGLEKTHLFAGQANRNKTYNRDASRISDVVTKRAPVILEHSSDMVHQSAWSVAAGEILHTQLSPYTDNRFRNRVIGMTVRTPDEPALEAEDQSALMQEEAVVHAVDLLWVQVYALEKGQKMTAQQIATWQNMFPGTKALLDAVKHLTTREAANQIIEWYKQNPKKIKDITGL